ncbi:SCO family protein [Sulfuriferula sp. AH1]|uniref:SCO family protein n=1 Tax=Sulfuriferula sp. AH1 TaxID=1985873 RepID=UPI000B3B4B8A|nr:SCO family protein [Sulfuriferula sp. AH1]ARU32599.1 SCO family protein [Sulfuriferula sp. AH1]
MRSIGLLAAYALAITLCGCEQKPPPPLTNVVAEDITGADYAQDFDLIDHNGQHRQLHDFRGKAVAVFFGYTHCPDVCPTTLYDFSVAMKMLGADAARVQVLFVTVDPERDTPAVLGQYVPTFNPTFMGLYADPAKTALTAKKFHIYYHKHAPDSAGRYAVDHSAFTYVYDTAGRLRLKMPFAETPENIASDLRQILR